MNAIVIVARLESERLPQKHLKIVEGLPLIKWLTKRIQYALKNEIDNGLKIIVASPATELNKKFEALYKDDDSVEFFRGSLKNIPLRVHECSENFGLNKVVIADGDNFLLSMKAIKAVYEKLLLEELMVKTQGLPLGMNVMGWRAEYLKSIITTHNYDLLETGWGRIFKEDDIKKIIFGYSGLNNFNELRFTTDYPADLEFMEKIFQAFGESILSATDDEIIHAALEKDIYKINGNLCKAYFENFYEKMKEEKEINHEA